MKYIVEYLEDKLKVKPLGKVSTKLYERTCGDYVGEEIYIDKTFTGIIIYYVDYIKWLEENCTILSDFKLEDH